MPELDSLVPIPVQLSLLEESGARAAVRLWAEARQARRQLPTTALLVVLDHLRDRAADAAPLIGSMTGSRFDSALATCSFDAARALFAAGRQQYRSANIDLSVNYMVEAQREFLFSLTSGQIHGGRLKEGLGKYGVAVAFSSRWIQTSPRILRRAIQWHEQSIALGNEGAEAHQYLVELKAELFNQTTEEGCLREALDLAVIERLHLLEAELLLKRGLFRSQQGLAGATADFQRSSQLAQQARPGNGVEHVRRALVVELALSAILGRRPLASEGVRLPFGFLADLRSMPAERFHELETIVEGALEPMRSDLRQRRELPNRVANQVLASVLAEALERSHFSDPAIATSLVQVTADIAKRARDRYLKWRHAEALYARAAVSRSPLDTDTAVEITEALVKENPTWPPPRVTLARLMELRHGVEPRTEAVVAAWADATRLVVECPEFRREDLGGRSGVFAVEDARGDMSTALVFKPVISQDVGEREAQQIAVLALGSPA